MSTLTTHVEAMGQNADIRIPWQIEKQYTKERFNMHAKDRNLYQQWASII